MGPSRRRPRNSVVSPRRNAATTSPPVGDPAVSACSPRPNGTFGPSPRPSGLDGASTIGCDGNAAVQLLRSTGAAAGAMNRRTPWVPGADSRPARAASATQAFASGTRYGGCRRPPCPTGNHPSVPASSKASAPEPVEPPSGATSATRTSEVPGPWAPAASHSAPASPPPWRRAATDGAPSASGITHSAASGNAPIRWIVSIGAVHASPGPRSASAAATASVIASSSGPSLHLPPSAQRGLSTETARIERVTGPPC